jgi:hypothetical protein
MFTFRIFKQQPKDKPLQQKITDADIERFVRNLPNVNYFSAFFDAYREYNPKSLTYLLGFSHHTYVPNLLHRTSGGKMRENWKELLEFLNEYGVGKDKKSLKFRVLAKLFQLDPAAFTNQTTVQLIDATHNYLMRLHALKKAENPAANSEPELEPRKAPGYVFMN